VCESDQLEYKFVADKSPVCGCQECGLLFLNPQPREIETTPPAGPPATPAAEEIQEANAAERMQDLVDYSGLKEGRLLFVGADAHLASVAERMGFSIQVFTAKEFESLPRAKMPALLDGCVLFCALERMKNPLDVLRSIRSALKYEGCLMIISPMLDNRTARLLRTSWWEFNRTNLFYFSVDTLQSLLIKAGFGDPLIEPDRSLVSLNYLKQRLAAVPRNRKRYRWLRRAVGLVPVLRDKNFRWSYRRTRLLVRAKQKVEGPNLSVIVPAYNEAGTFVELMDRLLEKTIDGVEIEVIVVESNSTDGTRELALRYKQHPRVKLILEENAQGKGYAVRTGLRSARGQVVLFQDADLEYDIDDYDALIAPLLQYRNNFVLGSRHTTANSSWKIREFGDSPGLAAFFNLGHLLFLTLFNFLYSQRLSDPFTMFKVFRRDCLYGLSFECNRFDFDHEIVIKLLRKGYKPLELPVNYCSRSMAEGKKVTVFRDPLTWIRALLKFRKSPLYGSPGGK
jgi:hypothetical protein